MLSKLEQMLSRLSLKPTLAGSSMLVRLRAGILGLLGLIAAVGLGLIAFVSQQGWPGAFDSPLPEEPIPLVRNDAIALPPSLERDKPAAATAEPGRRGRGQRGGPAPVANLTSDLTASRQVAQATPPVVPPAQPDDASAPAPSPGAQSPSVAAPAPPPAKPPAAESTSVPVAAGSDEVSPGSAGKSKRKSYGRPSKAPGPPPSVGKDDAPDEHESYDKGDSDEPDYDDEGYEDDDSSYEKYDDDHDRGRHGKRDWDGD